MVVGMIILPYPGPCLDPVDYPIFNSISGSVMISGFGQIGGPDCKWTVSGSAAFSYTRIPYRQLVGDCDDPDSPKDKFGITKEGCCAKCWTEVGPVCESSPTNGTVLQECTCSVPDTSITNTVRLYGGVQSEVIDEACMVKIIVAMDWNGSELPNCINIATALGFGAESTDWMPAGEVKGVYNFELHRSTGGDPGHEIVWDITITIS